MRSISSCQALCCWQTSPAVTRSNPDDPADEADRNPDAVVAAIRPSDNRPSDAEVVGFFARAPWCKPDGPRGAWWWVLVGGVRLSDRRRRAGSPYQRRARRVRDDELAMRYGSPALPVPEVLAIGEGFGRWFANLAGDTTADSSRRSALTKPTLSARPSSSFSRPPDRGRDIVTGVERLGAPGITDRRDHDTAGCAFSRRTRRPTSEMLTTASAHWSMRVRMPRSRYSDCSFHVLVRHGGRRQCSVLVAVLLMGRRHLRPRVVHVLGPVA